MTARELVDLTYFLIVENARKEEVDRLDSTLNKPADVRSTEAQEDRRAEILAMGGGIA